jgi:hypothetical protein
LLKVLRIDRKLFLLEKPPLLPVKHVGLTVGDILVLCAGFEDRAIKALKVSLEAGESGYSVILINYLPFVAENRLEEIRRICQAHCIPIQGLQYDRPNPSGIGETLLTLPGMKRGNILVDISGMSKLLIVQILAALGKRPFGFSGTTVLYTMAQSYPPNEYEVDEALEKMKGDPLYSAMFLSSGVFEVTIVPELSSTSMEGQPIRLITFPSFNPNQLAALRSEIQSSSFTLIHGIPPLKENAWRPAKIKTMNRIDSISNREDREASTLDYEETLNLLLEAYDKYGMTDRIVVAPTGSKMQTVAVGILRAFMDDVQIVYPTPRIFPKPHEYTTGATQLYRLDLNKFSAVK